MKKKILAIPDIHGRTFWKQAVEKHKDDSTKIIFNGDYLDPYPWENITRKDAINNLKEIITFKENNDEKVILLTGNHDFPYIDKETFYTRSRYDNENAKEIEEIFNTHKNLFQIAYEEEINKKKYLFSHAGITKHWYEFNKNIIGDLTVENLNKIPNTKEGIKILCQVSYHRWGPDQFGSIVWADIQEIKQNENEEIPWDYQIFGHTQQEKKPIITNKWACLDCRKAFIINDDNEIKEA